MNAPSGIVVLGMHRSGTSAVMSALQAMGVHVGNPSELTASNWDNPKGFFERKDMRRICDTLLHGADADWWKLADFSLDRIPSTVRDSNVAAMSEVLEQLHNKGFWALKEPRLCLLFPLLGPLLSVPMVLFVARHPVAVALSLQRRHGYSLQAGVALWERYNREALQALAGIRVIRLIFEELLDQPDEELERVSDEICRFVPGFELNVSKGAALIDPSSRHHIADPVFNSLLTEEQIRLWKDIKDQREPDTWSESGYSINRLQLQDLERVDAALQAEAIRERDAHRKTRAAKKEIDRLRARLAALERKKAL